MKNEKRDNLEINFIDDGGIKATIDLLIDICYGKAEHLRVNWQDNNSAKYWDKIAKILESANSKIVQS